MKSLITTIFSLLLLSSSVYAQKNGIEVRNLEKINSEYNDIHAVPFGEGQIILSSAREKSFLVCKDPELKNELYTSMYFAESDGQGDYKSLRLIEGDLKINYHDAVPAIHPQGKMMIFTRTYIPEPDLKVLQLFSAEYIKGNWRNVKSLPCNSTEYSNLHAAWSPDGKQLYFASNRAPGQDKNTNIFVMDYNEGNWGAPRLLSDQINTKGTEYFTYVDSEGRLFFASDGHKGYGGLDIFFSENIAGEWTKPEALPRPINSKADDFGYVALDDGLSGFFASDRKGGKGKDDVYSWNYAEQTPEVKLIVINKENKIQLGEAEITIEPIKESLPKDAFIKKKNLENTEMISKEKKPLNYKTIPQLRYSLKVKKEGFEPLELIVTAEELAEDEVFELPLKPIRVFKTIEVRVVNVQTLKPISNSSVLIINKVNNKIQNLETDSKGMCTGKIDCSVNYEIRADKEGFVGDLLNLACLDDAQEPIKATLKLAPPVKKGLVIVLENLYYDFDKANIRSDAAFELDKVVRLMQRYPSMEIELGSHTDVRGDDEYNRDLSQRRADSAIEYIIAEGISRKRITARGYGETKIVNRCANGVTCTEEEHQKNRRTEIKVTEFDEEDVTIESK